MVLSSMDSAALALASRAGRGGESQTFLLSRMGADGRPLDEFSDLASPGHPRLSLPAAAMAMLAMSAASWGSLILLGWALIG